MWALELQLDARLENTNRILRPLFDQISEERVLFENTDTFSYRSGNWELHFEDVDWLYGMMFVAIQRCVSGMVADYQNATRQHSSLGVNLHLDKVVIQAIEKFDKSIAGKNVSCLMFCNAIGNYFKHQESWQRDSDFDTGYQTWIKSNFNTRTIETLYAAGMTEEYQNVLCVEAAYIIRVKTDKDLDFVTALNSVLSSFKDEILLDAKQIKKQSSSSQQS